MMDIGDTSRYQRYREVSATWPTVEAITVKLGLPMLLFGSMGAITWAIRGTDGWGGIEGTILPGMTWGLLWYYLNYRRGIDSRTMVFWMGIGLALGGELGYGQYISWIMGSFSVGIDNTVISISKWQGYLWLMICGIAWGGLGGIFLGWVLNRRMSIKKWAVRLLLPVMFAGLGWLTVSMFPQLFFPYYSPEFYREANCPDCVRAIYTNRQNFLVLMYWFGALAAAKLQKDKPTLVIGSLLGIGFGFAFAASAIWCLGYDFAPGYIDWWKMWEMTAGFCLGLLYALALYWTNKEVDETHNANGVPIAIPEPSKKSENIRERNKNISLIISVTLLLYILYHGASYQLGAFLGFYETSQVDQYSWPLARIIVFVPGAILIIGSALVKVWQYIKLSKSPYPFAFEVPNLHEKMNSIITAIAAFGILTIWPSKIGVLYAALLWIVLSAINRLNYHYKKII